MASDFNKTIKRCKGTVASWPQWKRDQAEWWLAQLKRDQEIEAEQLRSRREYSNQGWGI